MTSGAQVRNGKAFEYALATQYFSFLKSHGVNTLLVCNNALDNAERYFNTFDKATKVRFEKAAFETINTIIKIEPGLTSTTGTLEIFLNEDNAGEHGDVRDVVFKRSGWEIGFSAKNNNDAVKHSRLGKDLDFSQSWFGIPCSQEYWHDIKPIFDYIESQILKGKKWSDLGNDKLTKVYVPLLNAFRREIIRIAQSNKDIPKKLIQYLIGTKSFYKVIKDDSHNLVIVKAFNIGGKLNHDFKYRKSRYKIPKVNLPTRIVEFEFKPDSSTTLNMILDNGWEISFRIHSASTKVERSLKFDIQLLGNPPILFTQHIFQ